MPGESIKNVLGFDASDAITNLRALALALEQYNVAIAKSANATKLFNQASKSAAQTKDIDAARQSWLNYGKTVSRLPATHPVMLEQKRLTEELSNVTKKASSQMILSWQSVIRIFVIQTIHRIIAQASAALISGVTAARNFGIAIGEVETIAIDVGVRFDELSETAIRVAKAIGQPLSVVAEAQYQLFSEDIGNARQNMEVFTAAQKLAITTVSSLDDAVLLLTGTIHAYNFTTSEAETIAAKYFKTIQLGRVRADEIANTMGRVTIAGAQLGIEFDELLATIASLTISGMDAAQALTLLTNIQLKLIRPTDEMKRAFKELHVESAEAGIQMWGLQGFLEKLRGTTEGTATEMGELWGRVRATRGALGITGAMAEQYQRRLELIRNTTSELLDERLELIWQTNAKQVEIELNKLSVTIQAGFGRGVNELMLKLFNAFGGAVGTIKALTVVTVASASAFLLVRTGALSALYAIITTAPTATAALVDLGVAAKALIASPLAWAVAVGLAVTAVIYAYNRATAAAKQHATDTINANRTESEALLKTMELELEARIKKDKQLLAELQRRLHQQVILEGEAAKEAATIEDRAFDSLRDQLKDRLSAIERFTTEIIKIADDAAEAIRNIEKESLGVKRSLEEFNFERQIRSLNQQQQILRLLAKSSELRSKASIAIRNNDEKTADALSRQSQDYAKQALQIADNTRNTGLIRQAEQGVRNALEGEVDLNNQLIRHKKDQARIAEQTLPDLYSQSTAIKEMVERFAKLKYDAEKAKTPKEFIKTFQEMSKLAGEIDKKVDEFQQFKPVAEKLDLRKLFEDATKDLREGLTGQRMDLSQAIFFDSIQIAQVLQITLDEVSQKVSVGVKLITGKEGARLQQTELTQLIQRLDTAKQTEVERFEAITTSARAQSNLNNLLEVQAQTAWDTLKWREKLAIVLHAEPELYKKLAFPDIVKTNEGIKQLTNQAINLIKEGAPIEQFTAKLNELSNIEITFRAGGLIEIADRIKEIREELGKYATAQETIKSTASVIDIMDQNINNASDSIGGMDAAAVNGASSFIQSMEDRAAASDAATTRIIANARAQATATAGIVTESLGGYIYRATGGSIGTDTVPAMLTPGEFVVNAAATKRFYSQLVAMNSGVKPVYRQEGGPVTTIGDININVNEAVTPQQTAREIMSSIRREIRRGTMSLR